ncbi:MAG: sigma-70 family RNA polymerase sigma factor [Verrucomicrobia bacterium]|nr:sigma-70 family RNA polymerase sigma factor [Verrucomicrobiota bacterium]
MSDVTQLLNAIEAGESKAAEQLLPLVYDELRKLAAIKMVREQPGQTLQPTALVHEAYLRLLGQEQQQWENSRHFFSAAAEAMRRILVERARHKARQRHGGGLQRLDIELIDVASEEHEDILLFVHEALETLAAKDPVCAELISLRFFAGLSNPDAARLLGLSERTAKRNWAYARAWLAREIVRIQASR